ESAPQSGNFDVVLVAAAAQDATPLALAARLARSRARIVALGLFPLELARDVFFSKELNFVVSRSGGPGRYDPEYEELGLDYPLEYVRWTEQRNLEAFLDLVDTGRLPLQDLITHRFPIEAGAAAYQQLLAPQARQLGLLIEYPSSASAGPASQRVRLVEARTSPHPAPAMALIGAGRFARSVLIPALANVPLRRAMICSRRPLPARGAAERFGFEETVSDSELVFQDPDIAAVIIATRHDSHADLVLRALRAGKAVFVEKPLVLTWDELSSVTRAVLAQPTPLMVGYNRRFAPLSLAVRDHFAGNESGLLIQYRVNAGRLPAGDWTQISDIGGGRIIGEACHFVDWISFATQSLPDTVSAVANRNSSTGDEVVLILSMENGAIGVILYTASGSTAVSKERVECFSAGKTAIIEDWSRAELADGGRRRRVKRPGKGHAQELSAWAAALCAGQAMPISVASL